MATTAIPAGALPPAAENSYGYEVGGDDDPAVIAQKKAADERAQKRAERVHELIFKFLDFYLESNGDKSKILESWRIFLEDLDRKIHILHWISVNDIWCDNRCG
eukprot:1180748-Prorocentrum_minimum.AAC.3